MCECMSGKWFNTYRYTERGEVGLHHTFALCDSVMGGGFLPMCEQSRSLLSASVSHSAFRFYFQHCPFQIPYARNQLINF